jgi:putative redox protein
MEVKVTWKDKLSFSGSAASGFTVPLGTDTSVGGDNDGFRPMELLAISLGGCTAMDVISILKKKRQDITGYEVRIKTVKAAEHPKVFTQITVEHRIEGVKVDPAAVERAIELSTTKYCPVQKSLSDDIKIDHTYQIVEKPAA